MNVSVDVGKDGGLEKDYDYFELENTTEAVQVVGLLTSSMKNLWKIFLREH